MHSETGVERLILFGCVMIAATATPTAVLALKCCSLNVQSVNLQWGVMADKACHAAAVGLCSTKSRVTGSVIHYINTL